MLKVYKLNKTSDKLLLKSKKQKTDKKKITQMSKTYSQVHKYWDIDTILTFLALYTTTMDFK